MFTMSRTIMLGLILLTTGCASLTSQGRRQEILNEAPKWYLKVPEDKKFIRATGTAESPMMSVAVEIATAQARTELAATLQTFVDARKLQAVGQNREATSEQNIAVVQEKFSSTFAQQAQQQLTLSRIVERKVVAAPKGYIAWILVELPTEKVLGAAEAEIEKQMATELRSEMRSAWEELRRAFREP